MLSLRYSSIRFQATNLRVAEPTLNRRRLYQEPWRNVPLEAENRRWVVTSPLARTVSAVVRVGTVRCRHPRFNMVEDDTHQILSPKLLIGHLSYIESR
jgi:hypothetical protein